MRFSTDATEITPSPTLGELAPKAPSTPALPAADTTTMPLSTSLEDARATGFPGQPAKFSDEAHVDHVGAVAVRPLQPGEDHVGRPVVAAADDAIGAERDVRRHALDGAVGADDAGDVRAVAVAVVRVRVRVQVRLPREAALVRVVAVAHEVVTRRDPAAGPEAATEIRMLVVDPGVDHRDMDDRGP